MKDETKHLQMNEAMWDEWAGWLDTDNRRTRYLREAQSKVISGLDIQPRIHFLDIGCGTGWAVGQAANLVNDQGLFYGVDLSPKMVEKAKSNFSGKENFHFLQANSESIPLDDDFFDIIICTNSFHHYLHPEKVLKEMRRLLKSGGKLYLLDPVADSWIIKFWDVLAKLKEPEHVKIYSTKEFRSLFQQAGLKYLTKNGINWHAAIHVGEK
ncbi:MAG TPA: class I SAM-dependent methyltransferase [Anaerolineales bacterium]|nr:class I SAM-dependent methyltransferase [Anaerolineales bacterium]